MALPSLAASRHVEGPRLSRLVRGELDWIVMKARVETHSASPWPQSGVDAYGTCGLMIRNNWFSKLEQPAMAWSMRWARFATS
jgi:hypothetical protein